MRSTLQKFEKICALAFLSLLVCAHALAQDRSSDSQAPTGATPPAATSASPPAGSAARRERAGASSQVGEGREESAAPEDLAIKARVMAKSLLFRRVPEPKVEFTGRPRRETVWESERENLPESVQPGVTYRDVGITLRITSVFPDIDRIVSEALGEAPASDDDEAEPRKGEGPNDGPRSGSEPQTSPSENSRVDASAGKTESTNADAGVGASARPRNSTRKGRQARP